MKYPNAGELQRQTVQQLTGNPRHRSRVVHNPTFLDARRALIEELTSRGWAVKPELKIPHATSPDSSLRLWFKPQAVWYTDLGNRYEVVAGAVKERTGASVRQRHDFKDARSISLALDIRRLTPEEFIAQLARWFPRALVSLP